MSQLAAEYRRTLVQPDEELPQGLDSLVQDCIGLVKRRLPVLRGLKARAETILQRAEPLRSLSDAELDQRLAESRALVRRGAVEATVIDNALAQIVEAAGRTLGKRPYAVQVIAALALHQRYLVEMLPGEGKTLTASLPAILAAWTGRPCHVVTANDYLAQRDVELMRPLYQRCGVTAGCVTGEMRTEQRRENYAYDLVYATSKELLADFLRDQMAMQGVIEPDRRLIRRIAGTDRDQRQRLVMRGLHTAIVDEADSVLADEATTPLIISVPGENRLLKEASLAARTIVTRLQKGVHYQTDERYREVRLTEAGERFVEELTGQLPPLWRGESRRRDLLRQALMAHEFYLRDKHYVIHEGKVVIVDEKTGRMMPGRSWSYGLHQAIEAKEGLELSDPTETHARLSFQRFFRLYRNLSGMSGTLQGIEGELWRIYRLQVIRVPTRLPSRRAILPDRIFPDAERKWRAIEDEVVRLHPSGRPILVGTRSITESEQLAERLRQRGIDCLLLNARYHAEEAAIIAQAGEGGRVTIATNMAGRGTDILIEPEVAELGGLHVIATERYESSRVDWQLFGRCARQGQPGSAQAFLCLEDELLLRHASYSWRLMMRALLAQPLGERLALRAYLWIQRKAERAASSLRRQMLSKDLWLTEMLSFSGGGGHKG